MSSGRVPYQFAVRQSFNYLRHRIFTPPTRMPCEMAEVARTFSQVGVRGGYSAKKGLARQPDGGEGCNCMYFTIYLYAVGRSLCGGTKRCATTFPGRP